MLRPKNVLKHPTFKTDLFKKNTDDQISWKPGCSPGSRTLASASTRPNARPGASNVSITSNTRPCFLRLGKKTRKLWESNTWKASESPQCFSCEMDVHCLNSIHLKLMSSHKPHQGGTDTYIRENVTGWRKKVDRKSLFLRHVACNDHDFWLSLFLPQDHNSIRKS